MAGDKVEIQRLNLEIESLRARLNESERANGELARANAALRESQKHNRDAEKQQTEGQAHDANARLQAIMNSVEEHISVIARNGDVLWHNAGTAGSLPAPGGSKCWEFFEKRASRCPHCVHPDIMIDGKSREYESRIRDVNGVDRDWWVRAVPLRNESGEIYAIVETARDITQRKRSEEVLREKDKLLASILDTASVGVCVFDEEGRYVTVNRAYCEMYGYTPEEVSGQLFTLILPPESQDIGLRMHRNFIAGKPFTQNEWTVRRKDGRQMTVSNANSLLVQENGRRFRIVVVQDITERKKAEEELRDANARLQAVMNSVEEHINVIALNGDVLWHNAASKGNQLRTGGLKCWEFFEKRESRCPHCVHPDILKDGKPRNYESRLTRADGAYTDWWIHAVPLRDEAGQIYAVVETARDITERKRAEEERRTLEAQMQHAQKLESLGVLAGGIAHDFNNLLMAILGNADLALMELSPVSPARDSIKEIEAASRRAAELCKQMLAYSGRGRFLIEPLDLNDIVTEMAHMLEISISKKAVLRYHFAPDLPLVAADATQMRQVIMNLIINASEAIAEKSGVISVSTTVMDCDRAYLKRTYLDEGLSEGRYVCLEVSDTGCGMDEATRARIFDPFFTTKFTGRGLGLAAVLGIVRGHKGGIKVYSEPGKGTTFKFLLPASEQGASAAAKKQGGPSEWRGQGTVLIADDEERVRAIAGRMLERMGFTVVAASDGREAIEAFASHAKDVVCAIVDLTMPHLDGAETFRELRRIQPGVRVILSSGYNEQDVTERFAGKGLSGFIQKPYTFASLSETLRSVLAAPR